MSVVYNAFPVSSLPNRGILVSSCRVRKGKLSYVAGEKRLQRLAQVLPQAISGGRRRERPPNSAGRSARPRVCPAPASRNPGLERPITTAEFMLSWWATRSICRLSFIVVEASDRNILCVNWHMAHRQYIRILTI